MTVFSTKEVNQEKNDTNYGITGMVVRSNSPGHAGGLDMTERHERERGMVIMALEYDWRFASTTIKQHTTQFISIIFLMHGL